MGRNGVVYTEEEYAALLVRMGRLPGGAVATAGDGTPVLATPSTSHQARTGADLQPTPYKSKTEARYAELLKWRQATGEIKAWWYEPASLRLGADCFYRPDFLVHRAETSLLEFVEVKGRFAREDSLVKLRAIATRFPCFAFTLAVWDRQQWTETHVTTHHGG